QASETGHLVVSTMHSEKVADTMERYLNLFPAEDAKHGTNLLANQLAGVLCQKLVESADKGLHLLVEHVENAGAMRDWIARRELQNIDQYIARGSDPAAVSFLQSTMRVAGVIQPLTEEALSPEDTRRLVIDALKEGQRAKLENEWQLDFALQIDDLGRFRGNACYVSGAIEANFRRIPFEIGDLKSLGHSPVVDRWCDERAGLILVTGSSGSGKSTTLASMAQTIARRRSLNIVSIEDPIEFLHSQGRSLVNQREIGSDARDFASALKNA